MQPDYVNAWYLRGYSLYFLQRYVEAVDSYKKALEIKSDDSKIWYYQGIALTDLGRDEEALAAYKQVKRKNAYFVSFLAILNGWFIYAVLY
ncbi:MAG: tetratricopeptide repeat protein [Nostoc sp.]|uniref:tetratricopeptide repeat protein n=1 Tax=Nostoc sp. TaxID=1180 RepID=UPI002FFC7D28